MSPAAEYGVQVCLRPRRPGCACKAAWAVVVGGGEWVGHSGSVGENELLGETVASVERICRAICTVDGEGRSCDCGGGSA